MSGERGSIPRWEQLRRPGQHKLQYERGMRRRCRAMATHIVASAIAAALLLDTDLALLVRLPHARTLRVRLLLQRLLRVLGHLPFLGDVDPSVPAQIASARRGVSRGRACAPVADGDGNRGWRMRWWRDSLRLRHFYFTMRHDTPLHRGAVVTAGGRTIPLPRCLPLSPLLHT